MAQLERQLGQYNELLAEAAAPRTSSSPCTSPGGSQRGSPMQAALGEVRLQRAAEEAAALQDQLRAAQTEAASLRK